MSLLSLTKRSYLSCRLSSSVWNKRNTGEIVLLILKDYDITSLSVPQIFHAVFLDLYIRTQLINKVNYVQQQKLKCFSIIKLIMVLSLR